MQGLSKSQKKRLAKKKKAAVAATDGEAADAAGDTNGAADGQNDSTAVNGTPQQDDAADVAANGAAEGAKKKKKKKKSGDGGGGGAGDGSAANNGGAPQQTEPPSVPVSEFFPDGQYPEGEWQDFTSECASCCCFLDSSLHAQASASLGTSLQICETIGTDPSWLALCQELADPLPIQIAYAAYALHVFGIALQCSSTWLCLLKKANSALLCAAQRSA